MTMKQFRYSSDTRKFSGNKLSAIELATTDTLAASINQHRTKNEPSHKTT